MITNLSNKMAEITLLSFNMLVTTVQVTCFDMRNLQTVGIVRVSYDWLLSRMARWIIASQR